MRTDPDDLLRRLAADPADAGLFLDFDGTLAPIVDDPRVSALPPGLAPVLTTLAGRLGTVAIISGRPADFLAERAAVPGARLLGLYGLQENVDGRTRTRPEAAQWQPAVAEARRRLTDGLAGLDGVYVEDKELSVAAHWRNAPDRAVAEQEIGRLVEAIAVDTGLAREPGKLVEELRPPVDWDKGSAVRAVTAELDLRPVVYVGDDLGDLPAFAAVRERGGHAVAVDHGEETSPRLLEAADAVLDGTDAVGSWLEALRAAIDPG